MKLSKVDFVIIVMLVIDCTSLFIFGFTFGALFIDATLAYVLLWILLGNEKQTTLIRVIRRAMLIAFVIWLVSFAIVEGLVVANGKPDSNNGSGYLIVLGAGLKGEVPSISLGSRLDEADKYLKAHNDMKVIVSGGQGKDEDISEAEAMKRFLVSKGISADRIIKEDKSTSTFENLKFTKNILDSIYGQKNHKAMLITSDYHIFRTKLLAKGVGLDINTIPADTPLNIYISYCIREYFALVNTILSGIKAY